MEALCDDQQDTKEGKGEETKNQMAEKPSTICVILSISAKTKIQQCSPILTIKNANKLRKLHISFVTVSWTQ